MSSHVWEIAEFGSIDYDVEYISKTLFLSREGAMKRVEKAVDGKKYKAEWSLSEETWMCQFKRRRARNRYASRGFLITRREVLP